MEKVKASSWQTMLNIWFEDIVFENEKAWAFAGNFNVLLELDFSKGHVKALTSIPWEERLGERLYAGIEKYKELLILIPMAAQNITIYNLKTDKLTQIIMPSSRDIRIDEPNKFFGHCIVDHHCFLFGNEYAEIICLNLETYSVIQLNDWVNELTKQGNHSVHGYFMKDLVIKNGTIVIPSSKNNSILLVDPQTLEIRIQCIGRNGGCYSGICFDGTNFWLMAHHNKKNYVVRWRQEIEESEEIELPEIVSGWYINALYIGGKAVFYPCSIGCPIIAIDVNTKKIEVHGSDRRFGFAKQYHDKIYTMTIDDGRLCCLDSKGERTFSLTYDEEILSMYADIWGKRFKERTFIVEEKRYDFELYCRMNQMTNGRNTECHNSGKSIHNYCINNL